MMADYLCFNRTTLKFWRRGKVFFSAVLAFMIFIFGTAAGSCGEKITHERRTVRVGFFTSKGFHDISPIDGHRSGYGYDYLQNVAYHAGWKLEYIDCNWVQAHEMLAKGEIDLITDVSKTPEREKKMLFANMPMGAEEYYIYTLNENSPIKQGNIASFANKRIGVRANTVQVGMFRRWVKENNVNCILVEYSDDIDRNRDFLAGKIDAAIDFELYMNEGWIPVLKLGESSFYIVVSPGQTEILNELNAAQEKLFKSSPRIIDHLKSRYFRHEVISRQLTQEERDWLKDHKDVHGGIKLGYVDKYLPYCTKNRETGQLEGALAVFVEKAKETFGLEIECVPYESRGQLYEAMRNGDICACFPVYNSLWQTEELGFMQTEPVVDFPQALVYKDGSHGTDRMKTFAVARSSQMQTAYIRDKYPEAKIVFLDSYNDCFKAINNDSIQVDGMFINTFILSRFYSLFQEYTGLSVMHMPEKSELCIGVRYANPELLSIFNKTYSLTDGALVTSALVQNSQISTNFSLERFYREHSVAIISTIMLLGALIILFLHHQLTLTQKAKQEADEEKERADEARTFAEDARQKAENAKMHIEDLNTELEAALDREKETQAAVQEAFEAANLANEAKTNFLANMSHDIRTPMNAIIGMTAIAGTHIDDKERVADCLAKITSSSKHLLGLINDVLDMSKIEAGKLELALEEFHLPELIENLITISRPLVESKKHEFNISLGKVEHEYVIGDSQRIQQVFLNIISNAVKYTPDGGKISLNISEKPSTSPKIGVYEFIIADNGIGMDKDFLPHIFEPFARAKDRNIEKITGTGLGMSITNSIIAMMNGDIKVDSELGKGSTFTITLCLKLREEEEIADYSSLVDLSVLVVDDDEITGETACDILHDMGMNGEYVSSGEQAVEKVEQHHKDNNDYFAIIIDWKMPGMDGVETTREVRRIVGEDALIIIISAYDWIDIEMEARAAGANCFISKPLFKSRMLHLFHELTDGEKKKDSLATLGVMAENSYQGKRALLVEDNELNAEIATEILEMTGLTVEWVDDGKKALDTIAAAKDDYYQVIFMDIQMPVMNGYDATRAIRNLPRNYPKRVPIIAMTANAFAQDVLDAKTAGMNEHIAKPIDLDQLNRVLRKWLG